MAGLIAVHGKLVSETGAPLEGHDIVLFTGPTNKQIAEAPLGRTWRLTPLSQDVTGRQGQYSIKLPAYQELAKYADASGIVNFELQSTSSTGFTSFFFSRQILERNIRGLASQSVVHGRSFLTNPLVATLVEERRKAGTRPLAVSTPRPDSCYTSKQAAHPKQATLVGGTYSTVSSGLVAQFIYTTGANSSLGVGVSATGDVGSFHEEGTRSVSTTSVLKYGPESGSKFIRYGTDFEFDKMETDCYSGTGVVTQSWQAEATAWEAAEFTQATGEPPTTYCVKEQDSAGGEYDFTSTKAYTFSGGASTAGSFGINLDVQTGWSKQAEVDYSWTKPIQLCGASGYPGSGSPQRVTAIP